MMLAPFFTYFGGKYRSATRYPPPLHESIVEPFAGSAGYALRYPDRRVHLVDKSETVAGVWSYLIRTPAAEIRRLPLLDVGVSVDTLDAPQEARWLIGFWVSPGSSSPKKTRTLWNGSEPRHLRMCTWSEFVRERIAKQVDAIRHWRVTCGDYSEAPDTDASWFIDPPYQGMGKHYPCGADDIDFTGLGNWCRERRGQVIVCEQAGADWLPFRDFGAFKSNKAHTGRARSAEALWMNDFPGAGLWLPGAA